MNAHAEGAPRSHRFLWMGLALYAIAYLWLLPGRVLVVGDDFAYLESIAGTLASGRLYTHEFLQPYSALLTLISTLVFWLTDNFYLSTYGPLGLCSLLNFVLLYRLFEGRLMPGFNVAMCLALCTAPIYLGKSLEFVALVPFISLLLAALVLYRTKPGAGFYVVTFLAFSLRQTGILLLALPVYDLLEQAWRREALDRKRLLSVAATALACAAFSLSMNSTFAREVGTERLLAGFSVARFLTNLELVLLLNLAFVSTWNFFLHPIRTGWLRKKPRNLAIPALLTVMCVQLYLQRDGYIQMETPLTIPPFALGHLDEILSLWFLASIWLMDYRRLRPHRLLFVMACWMGALSLRDVLWDYYPVGLFILSAVWVVGLEDAPRAPRRRAVLILSAVLALNFQHILLLKGHMDRVELQIVAYEELLRGGRLQVTELAGAPFGFLGWKFYDYFMDHDARRIAGDLSIPAHRVISAFGSYLEPKRVEMVFDDSFPREATEVLAAGRDRLGLRKVDWWLLRRPGQRPASAVDPKPYPLTNREWSRLLGSTPSR